MQSDEVNKDAVNGGCCGGMCACQMEDMEAMVEQMSEENKGRLRKVIDGAADA